MTKPKMTDFRELCKELVTDLREARDSISYWSGYAREYVQEKGDLQSELERLDRKIQAAREALAEPVSWADSFYEESQKQVKWTAQIHHHSLQ